MTRNKIMGVHHCFEGGTVVFRLESTDKYAALGELIRKAPVFREVRDLPSFEESVFSREKMQSTGLGHGVAVAHGRIDGVKRVIIALGLSHQGIPFDAPDGEPVRLLFLIASPMHTTIDYLQALSTLVRVLRDCSMRETLLSCADAELIEKTIRSAFSLSLGRFACSPAT